MEVSIINMDGLEPNYDVDIMSVHRFRLFEDEWRHGEAGAFLDLDYLLKKAGAVDMSWNRLNTPCPSRHREWARGVTATLESLRAKDGDTPLRIYVPGSARPLFSESGENGYLFSCACDRCMSQNDAEEVNSFMDANRNEGQTRLDWFLDNSDAVANMRDLMNRFDDTVKAAAARVFPGAEIRLYTRAGKGQYPESFSMDRDDYAIFPEIAPDGYRGEILLESVSDFQLAAALNSDAGGALLLLPEDADYDPDMLPEDVREWAYRLQGEVMDIRAAAQGYLNLLGRCR